MTDTHIPESKCYKCGHILDGAFHPKEDYTPEPGNLSICCECGSVSIFGEDMRLVAPTPAQQAQFDAAPEVQHVKFLVALANIAVKVKKAASN